MTVYYRY